MSELLSEGQLLLFDNPLTIGKILVMSVVENLDLPNSFYAKEEGKRIFIFKEGYEDLLVGSTDSRLEGVGATRRGAPAKKTVQGRGEYPCLPLKGGGAAIVRRVRHGGLWGKIMRDVLWGAGRPIRELVNTNRCLERDIPTAEILGLRLERQAWPFYRAEVFSRELKGTLDLLELLRSPQKYQPHKRKIVKAVATAVRAMHEGGLYHKDLHLKNILITKSLFGRPFKAHIIDLDKSRLHDGALPLTKRIKNLIRLDRSVEKFMAVGAYCRASGRFAGANNTPLRPITQRDKLRFLRDYLGASPPQADWKGLARALNPRHTLHRCWWKMIGAMGVDRYKLSINLRRRGSSP